MATGEPAAWKYRPPELDALCIMEIEDETDEQLIVTMEYESPGAAWPELQRQWLDLQQRSVLDARDVHEQKLFLAYAALNWKRAPLVVESVKSERLAGTWIIDLADALRCLAKERSRAMHLFWNAVVWIDLDERPRLAFSASATPDIQRAPELRGRRAKWNEATLVYQVGALIAARCDLARSDKAHAIVERCLAPKAAKRWRSLDDLIDVVEAELGASVAVARDPDHLRSYRLLESAIGWLEAGDSSFAVDAFRRYMNGPDSLPHRDIAQWGLDVARTRLGLATVQKSWSEALADQNQRKTTPDDVPALVEAATKALREGDTGYAASLSQLALTHAPEHPEALHVLADTHLQAGRYAEALNVAERLPDNADANYRRGKILIALGRGDDARDAFDRALLLAPTMVEAMLLRREVVRTMNATRGAVGEQAPMTIEIPPALAELREVLLSGDAKRAITALSEPRYADDPDAQLVLARFQLFDGDNYQAAHVYDHVAARWPARRFEALLGKANALLDFGYHQSALAMFDQLVADEPTDLDASEGRARALDKLGRTGEAAAEFRRFVSLATAGSDLRVRVAQAWLDAHPL